MESNTRAAYAVVLLLTVLAFTPQPCRATAITFDLTKVNWRYDSTTESFDLSLPAAKGNLTFALDPTASYSQSVPTAFNAVEKQLNFTVTDRTGWALMDLQADFHFNSGLLEVDVTAIQVKSLELSMRNPPSINARETFWVGPDTRPPQNWAAMWGGAANVATLTNQYHFTLTNDSALFGPVLNLPAFVFPDPVNTPGGGGGDPFLFADPLDSPEPSTIVLFGTGFCALAAILRRKRAAGTVVNS